LEQSRRRIVRDDCNVMVAGRGGYNFGLDQHGEKSPHVAPGKGGQGARSGTNSRQQG
jgi:hypothetical protein